MTTTNENTIEDIKYEAKSFCDIADCYLEACQQEAELCYEQAVRLRKQDKRKMLAKLDEIRALVMTLDNSTK